MSDIWYSQIESYVLTEVSYYLKDREKAPYPNLNCTTKSQSVTPSVFPTLYLHMMTPAEMAQDLENDYVNSVLATIEVIVYSNDSEKESSKIIADAINVMKKSHWNITMFPDPQTVDKISYSIARFRKLVTENDIQ